MKYIALLRGINISGKNKISMPELKKLLEENNYQNVFTYLNSGNIIFECNTNNKQTIMDNIHTLIKTKFLLDIPVYITTDKELETILNNSPKWWVKTASTAIKDKITIRTANTMRKILEICQK